MLAGQWFYNWQAVRLPESGSYLSSTDSLNFGGDSLIVGPRPAALERAGRSAPSRYSASIGDFGMAARWSPEALDGTLGFYYRNATDILPQLIVTPGVQTLPSPQVCQSVGGQPLAPTSPTPCLINGAATNVAELQNFGKVGTYQTAYGNRHPHLRREPREADRRRLHRDRSVLPAEHAALERPGRGAAGSRWPPSLRARSRRTAIPADGDTPGALGSTWHGVVNAVAVVPKTALFDTADLLTELTWMHVSSVTQNEAVYRGRAGYVGVDKPTSWYVGLAINFTPTWFQVFPGVDLTLPLTWAAGLGGTAATVFGGNKNAGNWSVGLGATIDHKYLVNLSYIGYYGQHDTDANGAATTFAGPFAGHRRSRLGLVHLQDDILRRIRIMFRKTLIALAAASLCSGAWAAVSADEAKQLGNTLTPIGAEKVGNKDGTIPAYTGGLTTPPAGFKKGDGIRPDPFASEKPLYSIDCEEHGQVRGQADRGHEGAPEALSRRSASTSIRRIAARRCRSSWPTTH